MRKPRNWNIGITFVNFKIQRLHPMIPKHVLFIINPISGTRRKRSIPSLIQKHLDHTRFTHEVCFTEHAGHATEIAAQAAADGVDTVVAVGGDGTINEVARSLVHTKTALAIIPCGSGNGLARHLELPQNARGAIDIINKDTVHCLDYGMLNDHPFFCTCGMGFDAFVSMKFAESGKRGPISYAENILREGLKYEPETYTLEDETGTKQYKAFLISCANASQYGNNAYIAPQASMSDGLIDVVIMEPFDVIEAPQVSFDMFNKTLDKNSKIKSFRCKKLHITRSQPGVIHYDGDPVMTGAEIDVHLEEKGIKMVVNPFADKSVRKPNMIQNGIAEFFNDLNAVRDDIQKDIQRQSKKVEAISKMVQRKLNL